MIGRLAGTVSSSGPSILRSTRRFANSGSRRSTDSFTSSLPSSTSIMAAAAVIGLVIEAMRKIVSWAIGGPSSAIAPTAIATPSSRSPTRPTAPLTVPAIDGAL